MEQPVQFALRKTHPNLWIGIMGFGVYDLVLGVQSFVSGNFPTPFNIPEWSIGIVFLFVGALTLYGANSKNLIYAKACMLLSIISLILLGIGYLIVWYSHDSLIPYTWTSILFHGLIQYAPFREPALNPVTEKKE